MPHYTPATTAAKPLSADVVLLLIVVAASL
jgi:hypothetical protein